MALAGLLSLCLPGHAGADVIPGSGLRYPTESRWNSLYLELEEKLPGLHPVQAAEELTFLVRELEKIRSGSPSHQVVPLTLPAGRGYALGSVEAIRRLVEAAPPQVRSRHLEFLEPHLAEALSALPPEPWSPERVRFRHQVLRDHPGLPLTLRLAREHVVERLEAGELTAARRALEVIRSHSASTALDRLRAGWLALQLLPPGEARRALVEELRAGLENDPPALTADRISELREDLRTLESSSTGVAIGPDGVRHPFWPVDASPGIDPATEVYALGSVEVRRPFESSELRSYLDRHAPRVPPRVTPLENSGARAPNEAPPLPAARIPDLPLPFHAAADARLLYLQTYEKLHALDARTLEERWTAPLGETTLEALGSLRVPAPAGDRVIVTTSELIESFDVETGKLLWKQRVGYSRRQQGLLLSPEEFAAVGGLLPVDELPRTETPGSDLVPVSLTPVTPAGSMAVVGARVRVDGQTFVYAIGLSLDGEPLWSSYLGSSEGSDPLGMSATLSPPRIVDDRVIISTNCGFVASLDLHDGQIIWLQAYPRLSEQGKRRSIDHRDRWQPNPVLHHRGELLIAPGDADELFRLRARDGKILGRLPRLAQTTLLGVRGDLLVLGGPYLRAISLDPASRGELTWTWRPPSGAIIPQGRSCLERDKVLVSDLNALYTVDIETGREVSTSLWDFRGGGGNLLPLPSGHLAVASSGGHLIYNHRERERDRIELLPAEAELRRLSRARLELKNGELEAGIATLEDWQRRGYTPPPNNSPVDRILFEISELLRYSIRIHGEDRPSTPRMLELLIRTERQKEYRAVAALQAAKWYHHDRRPAEALAVIQEALRSGLGEVDCAVNEFLEIPGHVLATHVLKAIREGDALDRAAYRQFEWSAQEEIARARRSGTHEAFQRIVRRYPTTDTAGEAQLELARYFKNKQNHAQALGWLIDHLRDYPGSDRYVSIALDAVELQTRLNRFDDARELLLALREQHGEEVIEERGSARFRETVEQYVTRRLRDPGFLEGSLPAEGRWLRFPVRPRWRSPANLLTSGRDFFTPGGEWPVWLRDAFFTQSSDLIECRSLETGLPIWNFHWSLYPDLEVPRALISRRFQEVGAHFFGDLLIYHDDFNALAIDAQTGRLRWNVTFPPPSADDEKEDDSPLGGGLRLRERIRQVETGTAGTFIKTSEDRILCHDSDGGSRWKRKIRTLSGPERQLPLRQNRPGFLRTGNVRNLHGPYILDDDEVAILLDPSPTELVVLSTRTGEELRRVVVDADGPLALTGPPRRIGNRLLLLHPRKLQVVSLDTGETITEAKPERGTFRELWEFPGLEDHVVISSFKTRTQLSLTGYSLVTGEPLWEHDKLTSRRSGSLALYFEDRNLYVLHGDDKARLAALRITSGPEPGKFTALPRWPSEITLSHFLLFDEQPRLSLTQDAIIFHDFNHNSLSIYDKRTGRHRGAMLEPINKFLADKERFQFLTRRDLLVIATDRGDAAFEPHLGNLHLEAERERLDRLQTYLESPRDWDNVTWLALKFFKEENFEAALSILDEALLSEHLPSLASPGMYSRLKALLDGIKEESIKYGQPEIVCRRLRQAPEIDGRLDEKWNLSHRVRLADPRKVNLIPSPGQPADLWKGEEDLGGTLYTGWDDEYFFFALDIDDHQIFPYDKKESFWKGDCLVIGLDPTGDGGLYHRQDDQLLTLALTVPNRKKEDKDRDPDDPGEQGDEPEEEEKKNEPRGQYAVKKKDDNSGVVYEVAIPWSTFEARYEDGEKPVVGKRFGLSLVVTDDDTGQGATKMLSLNPCHLLPRDQTSRAIWKHLKPEFFPRVVLE